RWSMFQLSEYASLWAFSIFGSVVFLGGWEFPMGSDWGWGWQLFLTGVKSLLFIFLVMWVRATVPRLRIDQLMNFCWKVLIEVSFLLIIVNGVFVLYDWPEEILALVNWGATVLFLGILYYRGVRRAKTSDYVGTYRQEEMSLA
ncbi:MAG: NADH-quinone oxidoreductase subunit H, partial [Dehalococcoidia bacterium]|nr:NADH-quinone oxidoreductase subunit H [Dehalococcoidia bacterium]